MFWYFALEMSAPPPRLSFHTIDYFWRKSTFSHPLKKECGINRFVQSTVFTSYQLCLLLNLTIKEEKTL